MKCIDCLSSKENKCKVANPTYRDLKCFTPIAQQPLSGSEQSSSPKCHHHDGDLTCEKTGEKTACEANKESCEDW
jgi:hypothetical protein